jgi:hypothetical protein
MNFLGLALVEQNEGNAEAAVRAPVDGINVGLFLTLVFYFLHLSASPIEIVSSPP